jgi:hypothetical protein
VQTLTEEIIHHGLANRVLSETQLARLLAGTPQRRHHLVNRAMKAGELVRLQRGTYLLDNKFRTQPPHPFALAQAFAPGSYISFEIALAHHGWIPEAVRITTCVTPGRKSSDYEHSTLGSFSFRPLAIAPGYFLELVVRQQFQQQTMLVAKPFRALMDLVCLRKVEWQGIEWLTDGLRVDREYLQSITNTDIQTLELVYTQKRVKSYLQALAKAIDKDMR